jgi:hypothetical protein
MALAYGSISSVGTTSTPTSVSIPTSGGQVVGLVYVVGDSAGDNITAVSWGGFTMTKVNAVQNPSDRWTSVWWIANPPEGATTITFTGGSFWRSYSYYYTGASWVASAQLDSSGTSSSASATSVSPSSTVVASNCWYGVAKKDGAGNRTDTASNAVSTMRTGTDAGGIGIADSNGTVATGSKTGTISISGAVVQICGIGYSIAPASGSYIESSVDFDSASATTHNIGSLTVTDGNFLIVGFSCFNTGGDVVTSVKWDSAGTPQNLTEIPVSAATNGRTSNVWYLSNPTAGNKNLEIVLSSAGRVNGTVASYTASNYDTYSSGQVNSGTAFSMPITTGVANCLLFASAYLNRNISTYGTNTTSILYNGSNHSTTVSLEKVATASATTLSYTMTTAEAGAAYIIVSIKPTSSSTTNSGFLAFM